MKFISTEISGVFIIEPNVFEDQRGYFFESFNKKLFESSIGKVDFVQDNESKSVFGTLRGLHYQLLPFAQSKLVRVIQGSVLDVAVDIRKGSPTFGKWTAVELTAENKRQMFIPKGFAHGFIVLSDEAIFAYKVDNYYSKAHERGIIFNDPKLGIDWRLEADRILLSDKDKALPVLDNAELFGDSL
jgi:dTDP-4-dehydrorhamnose 3,5-epimerase